MAEHLSYHAEEMAKLERIARSLETIAECLLKMANPMIVAQQPIGGSPSYDPHFRGPR